MRTSGRIKSISENESTHTSIIEIEEVTLNTPSNINNKYAAQN